MTGVLTAVKSLTSTLASSVWVTPQLFASSSSQFCPAQGPRAVIWQAARWMHIRPPASKIYNTQTQNPSWRSHCNSPRPEINFICLYKRMQRGRQSQTEQSWEKREAGFSGVHAWMSLHIHNDDDNAAEDCVLKQLPLRVTENMSEQSFV